MMITMNCPHLLFSDVATIILVKRLTAKHEVCQIESNEYHSHLQFCDGYQFKIVVNLYMHKM